MSNIPVIGKIFKAIDESPVLKVIVIAVIIYFTAGAAMSYFSSAGAGTAAAGGGMAATTASSTAGAAAAGATTATATGTAMTATATGTGTAAAVGTGAAAGTAGTAAAGTGAAAGTAAGTGAAAGTAGAGAGAGAATGSWMANNPMATMMLSQGVVGAVSSSEAEKEATKREEIRVREEQERREGRGLMGYDFSGKYAGPGIVASQLPEQQVQAAQAPDVAEQQVMVRKEELPKLNRQGQIALG